MNALTHGIFANPSNLPGEKKKDFVEFVLQLRAQLQPEGPVEEQIVSEIAAKTIELKRLTRGLEYHQAAIVKYRAAEREFAKEFAELRARCDSDEGNRRIAAFLKTRKPKVKRGDIDKAMDQVLTDEYETKLIDYVERRKRLLMHDLEHAYGFLQQLQSSRHAVVVLPPGQPSDTPIELIHRSVLDHCHGSLPPCGPEPGVNDNSPPPVDQDCVPKP